MGSWKRGIDAYGRPKFGEHSDIGLETVVPLSNKSSGALLQGRETFFGSSNVRMKYANLFDEHVQGSDGQDDKRFVQFSVGLERDT